MTTGKITDKGKEDATRLLLGGMVLFILGCVFSTFWLDEQLLGLFLCNFSMWMIIRTYKSGKVTQPPPWCLKTLVLGNLVVSGGLIVYVSVKFFGL